MKTLVLITSNFPFGAGEPFIEKELEYLEKEFEEIIILSQNTRSGQTRTVTERIKIHRYNTATTFRGFLNLPFILASNFRILLDLYRSELSFRNEIKFRMDLKRKLFLLRKTIKAIQLKEYLNKLIPAEAGVRDVLLYSYWLNTGAHAAALIRNRRYTSIARAHGSDLYEEKSPYAYLPLLRFTSGELDAVFFISENGRDYFVNRTGCENTRCIVSRLGVSGLTAIVGKAGNDHFTVVSCSNLIKLKRIEFIIQSLSLLNTEKKIRWIHFGDGALRAELEDSAKRLLAGKTNIEFSFKGTVPNREVLRFYYQNHVGLFLNASITEGVPVSIMEAQSFGIPVIAPDIGGIRELVTEGTGVLLPPDFTPADLSLKILDMLLLNDEQREMMRKRAYQNWKSRYNADVNYPDFINKVNSILALHNSKHKATDETGYRTV
jgi:glycosyltransferase involved in cell wall biosynthesis